MMRSYNFSTAQRRSSLTSWESVLLERHVQMGVMLRGLTEASPDSNGRDDVFGRSI